MAKATANTLRGRIFKSTGSWYEVVGEDGVAYQARIRGKFRLDGRKVTNPVAVGDWVTLELLENEDSQAVITAIEDRTNYIIRQSPKKTAHAHILATNLDQALLIATLTFPRTSLGFIDRFLVTAEAFGVPAAIVFNKTDLYEEEQLEDIQIYRWMYEELGYPVLFTSALAEEGIGALRLQIEGKTTLVTGHSGVGKSTLLNLLSPEISQKTGEVSTFANKGTHTTTFAEMFAISDTTNIIDTPGIKELGLVDFEKAEIGRYFPEFKSRLDDCKFYNCTHIHEPGCAVLEALEANEISVTRYHSYLSMVQGEESHR
ncbi:MAG TPA: ribosome small subunit-dependent GTPase A [Cytophagales bacterium]|nr:ribosome small subunit-dependent GTPase A [Cytophagales bacterium]HAA21325.1 ribosome small subunit-dependent GTPase A [Cytophagales bacterium]HAP58375.1 ribosome small subunit-dependent GTPase A [Cytophagales bacterium]